MGTHLKPGTWDFHFRVTHKNSQSLRVKLRKDDVVGLTWAWGFLTVFFTKIDEFHALQQVSCCAP